MLLIHGEVRMVLMIPRSLEVEEMPFSRVKILCVCEVSCQYGDIDD